MFWTVQDCNGERSLMSFASRCSLPPGPWLVLLLFSVGLNTVVFMQFLDHGGSLHTFKENRPRTFPPIASEVNTHAYNCTLAKRHLYTSVFGRLSHTCTGVFEVVSATHTKVDDLECSSSPNSMPFEKVYAINLPRRRDRRERIEAVARELGIEIEVIPGVDTTEPEIDYYLNKSRNVNRAQVACFRAHMHVYQDMMLSGYSTALILEDDAEFDASMVPHLPDIMAHAPADWDIIFLGYGGDEPQLQQVYPPYLYRMGFYGCCTHGYVLNLWSVIKLQTMLSEIWWPIDNVISAHIHERDPPLHLNMYNVYPPVVSLRGGPSDIPT